MAGRGQDKGIRRNEAAWRSLLSRFGPSGLGVRAFCRRELVSAASFYRWRGLLGEKQSGNELRNATSGFVDLGALNLTTPTARPRIDLTLDLGDGLVLHLVRH